jgi:hypothetical protein
LRRFSLTRLSRTYRACCGVSATLSNGRLGTSSLQLTRMDGKTKRRRRQSTENHCRAISRFIAT